jgi:hypothetical protein
MGGFIESNLSWIPPTIYRKCLCPHSSFRLLLDLSADTIVSSAMRADVITPFPICKEDNDDVDDVYHSDNGASPIAAILATNRQLLPLLLR